MPRRSYNQYCALAQALDRVGERWTLLLIRQLLTGPKRFKDLLDGLPGIGTNLLAERLKQLEADGLIGRAALPPPAASAVYELTENGRALEPALVALAEWGRQYLGPPRKGYEFHPTWALLAMQANFKPERAAGVSETYEYRVGGQVFHVRIEDGKFEGEQGPAWKPDMVLTASPEDFLALGTGYLDAAKAAASGRVKLEGSLEALKRTVAMFGKPQQARTASGDEAIQGRKERPARKSAR